MNLELVLVWLHVTGNLIWVGGVFAMVVLLLSSSGEAKLRGKMAREVYSKVVNPMFLASFVLGVVRLVQDAGHYFKETHYMHGKLLFVFIAIGMQHMLAARARKMAEGEKDDAGPARVLAIVFFVCVAAATFFVVLKIPQ